MQFRDRLYTLKVKMPCTFEDISKTLAEITASAKDSLWTDNKIYWYLIALIHQGWGWQSQLLCVQFNNMTNEMTFRLTKFTTYLHTAAAYTHAMTSSLWNVGICYGLLYSCKYCPCHNNHTFDFWVKCWFQRTLNFQDVSHCKAGILKLSYEVRLEIRWFD